MTAPKHPLFNLRLSPDARMRLRLIAGHKGLDTEAAAVRWLIAEKWEELKGDIAGAVVAEKKREGFAYEQLEDAPELHVPYLTHLPATKPKPRVEVEAAIARAAAEVQAEKFAPQESDPNDWGDKSEKESEDAK